MSGTVIARDNALKRLFFVLSLFCGPGLLLVGSWVFAQDHRQSPAGVYAACFFVWSALSFIVGILGSTERVWLWSESEGRSLRQRWLLASWAPIVFVVQAVAGAGKLLWRLVCWIATGDPGVE